LKCRRCERPVAGPDTNYCDEHMPQLRLLRLGADGFWATMRRLFWFG